MKSNKNREYRKYINEHRKNVTKVWKKFLIDPEALQHSPHILDITNKHIGCHDDSKYSGLEFEGYRNKFFPEYGEILEDGAFDHAWNHHQKNNPHHWEYWCLLGHSKFTALSMPVEYTLEMLCDWSAMSVKFKRDTPSEFFNSNRGHMLLHQNTIFLVESYLPKFDRIVFEILSEKNVNKIVDIFKK